ncbi:MAG: hypothetical protein AAFX50_17220, partial [Acidobacteriota bacterium]
VSISQNSHGGDSHDAEIAILYEHPTWFKPLFAELDRRGLSYDAILCVVRVAAVGILRNRNGHFRAPAGCRACLLPVRGALALWGARFDFL